MGKARPLLMLALGLAGVVAAAACGTSAVDVQACRQIESARCTAAANSPVCNIDLSQPVHHGSDAAACIRYYDTQCLHGLLTTSAPGSVAVNACVAAITAAGAAAQAGDAGACDVVESPQNHAACSFLIPTPPVDAGVDAADAGSDAADAAEAGT
jgi:hypothetical protein